MEISGSYKEKFWTELTSYYLLSVRKQQISDGSAYNFLHVTPNNRYFHHNPEEDSRFSRIFVSADFSKVFPCNSGLNTTVYKDISTVDVSFVLIGMARN